MKLLITARRALFPKTNHMMLPNQAFKHMIAVKAMIEQTSRDLVNSQETLL